MPTLAQPAPALGPAPGFARSRSVHNATARIVNRLVIIACCAAALATIAILFVIFGYILYRGFSSVNWALFSQLPGPPGADRPTGLRNAIAGTLILISLASCIGIPLGMLCGIYLAEYARDNWFSHSVRLVVDVLAGVPSIIVGVLAYEMLVIAWHPLPYGTSGVLNALIFLSNQIIRFRTAVFPTGFSAWAGVIALGFMMCPVIARTTEEMLKLVPKALREASIGLGASKFQTLFRIVIPAASAGIITGIMLAVARIAGETAPLLFTVLGSNQPTGSVAWDGGHFASGARFLAAAAGLLLLATTLHYLVLKHAPSRRQITAALVLFLALTLGVLFYSAIHPDLSHPFPSLTVKIYEYAGSAENDWNRQAWAGMLILITLVLVLNIAVRLASRRRTVKA
jgi:phosphate transport system permease protein